MLAAASKAEVLKVEYEEETAKFEACQVSVPALNQFYVTDETINKHVTLFDSYIT